MTVKELIELLSQYEDDQEVHFTYTYGDHWNTVVAPEVSSVEEEEVSKSDYHGTYKIVHCDDRHYDADKAKSVVCIS